MIAASRTLRAIARHGLPWCVTLAAASTAAGQTIRPIVSEYGTEARGRLELVNNGDRPLDAVLETIGFAVDEAGQVRDVPMPGDITVRLSTTSIRLPPKQTRYVDYEASAGPRPAWFAILARFSGYARPTDSGIQIQLEMPHYVYLLPRASWTADQIVVRSSGVNPETGALVLLIENAGPFFGRISDVEVRGDDRKASGAGFPLFPGAVRRLEVPWTEGETPRSVAVRSRQFSFERPLQVVP